MNAADARARLISERNRLTEVLESASRVHLAVAGGDAVAADDLPSEKASETLGREIDESVAQHAAEDLEEIDAALTRIEGGTYGLCLECGRPISDERLEFLPATRYCIEDQAKLEKARAR